MIRVTSTESVSGIPPSQTSCDKSVDPVLSTKSPPLSRVGTESNSYSKSGTLQC